MLSRLVINQLLNRGLSASSKYSTQTKANIHSQTPAPSETSFLLKHPTLPLTIDLDQLPVLTEATLDSIPQEQAWAREVTVDYRQKKITIDYRLDPQPLPNVGDVIKALNLGHLYGNVSNISEIKKKVFLGLHGTSINAVPIVMPTIDPQRFGNQSSYHSHPNPENHSFHIANTIRAALHYAKINGTTQSSYRDPDYYDDGIVMICCADPLPANEPYHHGTLDAWNYKKNRPQTLGQECLIPEDKHDALLNLGLFRIKGGKRLFPLQEGQTIYHEKKPYIWSKGELIDMADECAENRTSNSFNR